MARSQPFELDPAAFQEIADRLSTAVAARIIEVLNEQGLSPQPARQTKWLDALEVARRLGVSREWVYEHAEELGATRLGSGRRPRLRFPERGLAGPPAASTPVPQPTPGRARTPGLIPIHHD
jgi:predicted DNA-binding transcriptional regulator AlpA